MKLESILIANRGEIARRIIRTCKKRGIKTVSIYSEADAEMPYVKEADEAFLIGPPPVAQSYLNMEIIIEKAKESKVNAIHPGYGLLSENAQFAKRCEEEGILFIGPSSRVIRDMGDKITARSIMKKAGVPVVPGFDGGLESVEQGLAVAEEMGYPVMLKASAGGGGIGMQLVYGRDELTKAFASAKGRAKAYFGNDSIFIEKYIENPHHIEVQIVADGHGNVVHLWERECSVQRRHQKVIEEAPSPFITDQIRKEICDTAVKAAKAVNYTGAGTVEFIMDGKGQFYFLEMNTRLQVEHPVTEEITGLDLVALQIDIAGGLPIPFQQEDVRRQGHAIEFRIYAEDPKTFYPSPGTITEYRPPWFEGVRVDDGVARGTKVTPFYDPMIGKLIVSGSNREEALIRAEKALNEYRIEGIKSNLPFLREVLGFSDFQKGNYTTQLVQKMNQSE
ncbi:acetyl-CoA carboxylase biotin carboxylase subunit [Microaerobacter geothermalis]|uniref:acetyl-CoA carboxylase biotin carboxylase subunit n=1 Tax=Microaerobacter geothermalis TaxID=674972 RepID=UPI001F410DE0|nr:acetyl-CoA carboxylase biotin carboxylase subunit [Microaerobacter geothermalis]MCF6093571.1 acetyl-CoA carboxylase biotin carboxylase subunit [Microaerobacter geothermalis]